MEMGTHPHEIKSYHSINVKRYLCMSYVNFLYPECCKNQRKNKALHF